MKALPIEGRRLYQTWGIFGISGGGKTSLAATAPRPLFCDSNDGTSVIADLDEFKHARRVPVKSMAKLDRIYDNLTGTGNSDWSKRYDTPVYDSWDDMQSLILDNLAEKAADSRDEPDLIEQREYGIMYNKLSRYLRKMKAIPKHKIFIMSEKFSEKEDMMWPNLVGQMRDRLPYFMDHVAYLRVNDKGVRYLHLNPRPGEWYAKTRARWLPKEHRRIRFDLDDTTLLTDLFALIAAGPKGLKRWERRWN